VNYFKWKEITTQHSKVLLESLKNQPGLLQFPTLSYLSSQVELRVITSQIIVRVTLTDQGTCAKTAIAPLERVKILYQIRSIHYPFEGIFRTLWSIKEKEGVVALWKVLL
jgi:hypothetical protein